MIFSRLKAGCLCTSLLLCTATCTSASFGQEPTSAGELRIIRVRVLGLFSPARVEALRKAAASIEDAVLKDVDFEAAHATFEIRSDKAWKDVPAEKLPERIDQALRQASRSTFSAAPASATPPDRLAEAVIAAGGCVCGACELAAYEAVARVEGVERATVSFAESSVIVRYDREKADLAAIEEALKKRGVTLLPPTP